MKNDPGPYFRTERGDGSYSLDRVIDNVRGRAQMPWTVSRDGVDVAVIVPKREYERLTGARS